MSWFTRVLSCALTAIVVLLAALVLTGPGPVYRGHGPGGWRATYRTVAEEVARLERLERELRETGAATQRRAEVVSAVIEGRCPLPEAAAHFRELNRGLSNFRWEDFRRYYPGGTDGERCCRQVIQYVACRLGDRPDRGAAVVRRLEAELEERLRRGPILLPGAEEARMSSPDMPRQIHRGVAAPGTPAGGPATKTHRLGQAGGRG
jgi:hypothetical protein